MGRKRRKGQKESQNRSSKKRKLFLLLIGGIISGALVLFVLSGHLPFQSMISKKGKSFYVRGGETRPVLSPSLFAGMASEAYAAAKQYPKIMDQVYCYCKCDEPPTFHKSLLSCFTDNHGAG
jgi:hypothetical protein